MKPVFQFKELHAISDLHLGGIDPFQIFASTQDLVDLIHIVKEGEPSKDAGLVINGDFIDFLAERPGSYFDPDGAIDKLDRVLSDATFKPVFDALRDLVLTQGRTLLINLGNHDLELALPWVREHLARALCGNEPAARARLVFIVDGTGVLCGVGGARVLCLHGNEVDSWNVADFEKIRRIGRDVQAGKAVAPWIPNAGTQMVIDVMNSIKQRYPFVDLLKPEAEAVVPTLLALDPSALQKLRGIASVAGRKGWDAVKMSTGFLGDVRQGEEVAETMPLNGSAPAVGLGLERTARQARNVALSESAQLMAAVEQAMQDGVEPIDLVRESQGQHLGFWSAARDLVTGQPAHVTLSGALDHLDKDRSFDITAPDDTFKRIDAMVSADIQYVIAGHTHLERALVRRSGMGWYFNSGTWARLIKLEPEVRKDLDKFKRIFEVFKAGRMDALDAVQGLVVKRCSVVSICVDASGRPYGELRRMTQGKLEPVFDSRLPRV